MTERPVVSIPSIQLSRRQALGALSVAAAAAGTGGLIQPAAATPRPGRGNRSRYPKGVVPTELQLLDRAALSNDAAITIATLQGLIARPSSSRRRGPAIYLDLANGYQLWLEDLVNTYGLPVEEITDPWALVGRYRDRLAGYVLFESDTPTINVATTVAAATGSVAVSAADEHRAVALGLSRVADVRERDDAWAWQNYRNRLRTDLVVEQKADPDVGLFTHQLRDYATLAGAFTFYDGNSAFRQSVVESLDDDAAVLGWGDASQGEDGFVAVSSSAGVASLPGDWAANLACLSGVPTRELTQRAPVRNTPARRGRHQVAFVVTDGDNLQWMLNDLPTHPNWFGAARRGTFDIGWGVPPAMVDLAPSVLGWYYDNASAGPHDDRFVVGPSGGGYLYPSHFPTAELDLHTGRLARTMEKADLGVVQILDFDALDDVELWSRYLRHDQITGLIYLEYSRYDRHQGRVVWAHDKPVISARTMLWDGLSSTDDVIETLNAAGTDPTSPDGYSVVMLHCWSMNLDDLGHVVDNLAPHVDVVSPDTLVRMMTRSVRR